VSGETDLALRVLVSEPCAEAVGAVLMDLLGSFQEEKVDRWSSDVVTREPGNAVGTVALVFYPGSDGALSDEEVLAALSPELRAVGQVLVERRAAPRDWEEGWKDHFHPILIGRVRIRPPWEPALASAAGDTPAHPGAAPADVVINPGLGFGTGLHPTTRGTLELLQHGSTSERGSDPARGPLVDAGTGSGILAVAAAKLGWDPIIAFDNDPVALLSARDNVAANGVDAIVEVREVEVAEASPSWFVDATVLANMTLEPVLSLVRIVKADAGPRAGAAMLGRPRRLVVSGILADSQERELVGEAARCGFVLGRRLCEAEWVSVELLPIESVHRAAGKGT
jgi:ribosomal protein L11 methyltransferase